MTTLDGPFHAPEVERPPLEELFYDKPINRIITLRDASGRVGRRITINPCQDQASGRLMGVAELSPEQARERTFVVTADTFVDIHDGLVFDLRKVRDRLLWSMVQFSDFIAQDKAGCYYQNDDTRFYVEDLNRDLDLKQSAADRVYEAETWVRRLGDGSLKDLGRVMGSDMTDGGIQEIKLNLIDIARHPEKSQAILNAKKDPNFKVLVFFFRLLDAQQIKFDGELYRYQAKVLGTNPEQVVQWLKDGNNTDTVNLLYLSLNPSKRAAAYSGLPEDLQGGLDGGSVSGNAELDSYLEDKSGSFQPAATPAPAAGPATAPDAFAQLASRASNRIR